MIQVQFSQLLEGMQAHHNVAPVLSMFQYQVSGKAPKLLSPDGRTLYKCHIDLEEQFYSFVQGLHLSRPEHRIARHIPQYRGAISLLAKPEIEIREAQANSGLEKWLSHIKKRYQVKNQENKFLCLQNFMEGLTLANVLDIKIGGRRQKPKKVTKSVQNYKLKLNGMLKTSACGQVQFISKYHLNQISQYEEIQKNIAFFLNSNNRISAQLVRKIIQELKQLSLAIRALRGWKFVSSSVCIAYDGQNPRCVKTRFIDFGRAQLCELVEGYDEDTCSGVDTIIRILIQILQSREHFEGVEITRNAGDVVPLSKILKFQSNMSEDMSSPAKSVPSLEE